MKLGVEIRCLMHDTHHEFLNNKRRNIEQINVREKEQSDTGNIKQFSSRSGPDPNNGPGNRNLSGWSIAHEYFPTWDVLHGE
jgi:hypothetical protein